MLVKNEADKYLERVLNRCAEFSDDILVLDDGSTDGSDRIAWRLGCKVRYRAEPGMWGNEAPARSELWEWGAEEAGDGWLLVVDADMILHGDPRPLTRSTQVNSWAWVLYDLWNDERYYRCDTFWQGHRYPRPWMFRPAYLGYDTPTWPTRGIHTGHCPQNSTLVTGICDPNCLYWIHLSFLRKEHRFKKVEQYLSQAHQMSQWELAHARSVGD
jgi:glycosyltransferase involved in cell wall biosynthesis